MNTMRTIRWLLGHREEHEKVTREIGELRYREEQLERQFNALREEIRLERLYQDEQTRQRHGHGHG